MLCLLSVHMCASFKTLAQGQEKAKKHSHYLLIHQVTLSSKGTYSTVQHVCSLGIKLMETRRYNETFDNFNPSANRS